MILYSVQIISFFACMISALCKNKKNIVIWVFIANVSNFAVMLLAKETDGWANSLATCIRSLVFLYRDKAKDNKLLYFAVILHLGAFILSYQSLWSILLLFATLSVCISQWLGNSKQIKVWALISILCWLIYTLYIKLYLDIPKRLLEAILLVVSLISINKCKNKEIDKAN